MRNPRSSNDSKEIEAFVESFPEATFFHTNAWMDSLRAAFPAFDVFWITARRGGELVGVMPSTRIRRGPFYHLQSMPFGTYGDPLAKSDEACEELFSKFFSLARSPGCLGACIHLWNGLLPGRLPREASLSEQESRVVYLAGGFEETWQRASSKRRQLARRAERCGINARILERQEELELFYAAYRAEASQWGGVHPYPERLFFELWRRKDSGVSFIGAFMGDEFLGGHIDFFHKKMGQAWQGAMTSKAQEHEAASICAKRGIEEACKRGMEIFNLGSSGGDRGIIFFKESLGAERRSYPVLSARGFAGRVADLRRILWPGQR